MIKLFTEVFEIPKERMDQLGAFDPILNLDTRLFIDPALLENCEVPEFIHAKEKIKKYFSQIILLLKKSDVRNDCLWKKASSMLKFKEIRGTCIGYSNVGVSGNAIGKKLREEILCSIKVLVEKGEDSPEIFELLGVFQERVGSDRISDLITFILYDDILKYTERVLISLGIKADEVVKCESMQTKLLLLPKSILSPLPIAKSFEDIDMVCCENQRVRDLINKYFDFKNIKKVSKKEMFTFLCNDDFRKIFIDSYKEAPKVTYDWNNAKEGEYIWYNNANSFVEKNPLILKNGTTSEMVMDICNQFKKLIECNGLNKLLFDDKNKPKHESAAQLLFFGVAYSYCKANSLDLIREGNNGRGPVDFKVSSGYYDKVLVETKLSTNKNLIHGFDKQLKIYMEQEETKKAVYVIINVDNSNIIKSFKEKYNSLSALEKEKIKCIIIDATEKKSASKA